MFVRNNIVKVFGFFFKFKIAQNVETILKCFRSVILIWWKQMPYSMAHSQRRSNENTQKDIIFFYKVLNMIKKRKTKQIFLKK